jgi:hypothetical protein
MINERFNSYWNEYADFKNKFPMTNRDKNRKKVLEEWIDNELETINDKWKDKQD